MPPTPPEGAGVFLHELSLLFSDAACALGTHEIARCELRGAIKPATQDRPAGERRRFARKFGENALCASVPSLGPTCLSLGRTEVVVGVHYFTSFAALI